MIRANRFARIALRIARATKSTHTKHEHNKVSPTPQCTAISVMTLPAFRLQSQPWLHYIIAIIFLAQIHLWISIQSRNRDMHVIPDGRVPLWGQEQSSCGSLLWAMFCDKRFTINFDWGRWAHSVCIAGQTNKLSLIIWHVWHKTFALLVLTLLLSV